MLNTNKWAFSTASQNTPPKETMQNPIKKQMSPSQKPWGVMA